MLIQAHNPYTNVHSSEHEAAPSLTTQSPLLFPLPLPRTAAAPLIWYCQCCCRHRHQYTVCAWLHTCVCMRLAAQHTKTNALPLTLSLFHSHIRAPLARTCDSTWNQCERICLILALNVSEYGRSEYIVLAFNDNKFMNITYPCRYRNERFQQQNWNTKK